MQRFPGGLTIALAALLAACGGGDGDGGPTGPQTGSITGRVTNSGSGVANVQVSLSSGPTTNTNSNGQYTFSNVNAGSYTVSISVPSAFELDAGQQTTKSVTVTANATATVDWSLRPASGTPVDTVRLSGVSFDPAELTVKRGGTVVWINVSGSHTVTPRNHSAWQEVQASGANREVLRVKFDNAGNFNYVCVPHESAGMVGRITVQ